MLQGPQQPPVSPALTGADDAGRARAAALAVGRMPGTGAEEGLGAIALEAPAPERPRSCPKSLAAGDGERRSTAQLPANHLRHLHVHLILADTHPGPALPYLQPPGTGSITSDQPGKSCKSSAGSVSRDVHEVPHLPQSGSYLGK